jgi:hypothetical protein
LYQLEYLTVWTSAKVAKDCVCKFDADSDFFHYAAQGSGGVTIGGLT